MAIHLDLTLPPGSSSLPEGIGRAALKRLLLGLAPDEACHAANCYQWPGGLLRHRFTLTVPKDGGLFSVALSLRSPWADVIRHRALWSPEVPQPNDSAAAIKRSQTHDYSNKSNEKTVRKKLIFLTGTLRQNHNDAVTIGTTKRRGSCLVRI